MGMKCGWLPVLHLTHSPCPHTSSETTLPTRCTQTTTTTITTTSSPLSHHSVESVVSHCRSVERFLLVAMAGLAQTMMSCTAVRGAAWSALPSSSATPSAKAQQRTVTRISAVQTPEECNEEECAPTKEVGKLSMDWKTEDNSKVSGTYPPMARTQRKWTGYVEKDTAGQTNIYAVEPTIYVAESAISTGAAGGDASGSGNSLAVAGGLGLVAVASAAFILLTVGKNAPVPATSYVGPPLSYYISKFTQETRASSAQVPPVPESPPLAEDMSLSQPEVAVSE